MLAAEGVCDCRKGAMYWARTLPLRNSASVRRVASSSAAPPAITSRQRSSRCCESSSTMSASRVGDSLSDDSRRRTSSDQSGMLASGDESHGLDERLPGLQLRGEHPAPLGRHGVEPAAPLARLLDPAALDPATLLEAVEQRVQRVDVERQVAAGARVDELAQLVAVAGPGVEQREDEQLRRASLQLAIEGPRV